MVEDERQGDGEVEHDETLGTELVRKNFDGVRHDKRGIGDAVEKVTVIEKGAEK